jgi:hypothetical protein
MKNNQLENQPGIPESKFRTVDACQAPPRAVRTPRALRASAIPVKLDIPDA